MAEDKDPQADHKRKHLRAFGTDNYQCESNEWMANSAECINRLKQNKEHKRLQLDNETTEATSKYQQFAEKPEKTRSSIILDHMTFTRLTFLRSSSGSEKIVTNSRL